MSQGNPSGDNARQAGEYPLGPESFYRDGVPRGAVTKYEWSDSKAYPGTTRDYWVYVPAQYDAARPACVMVFQDGGAFADVETDSGVRVPIVFDNLIHQRQMPVTIGLFINPGREPEPPRTDPRSRVETHSASQRAADSRSSFETYPESQRAEEYDVVSDRYSRFLLEEMLPAVAREYRLTDDPGGRAIGGSSSGGICAWTVAWHRPDAFRKVLSFVGSFTDIRGGYVYPYLIRRSPTKPIRVFLQTGMNDLDCVWGHWRLANEEMAAALKFKGYDHQLVIGDGGHGTQHGAAILPEALRWLWRDVRSQT